MVSSNSIEPVVKGLLLMTNILSTVRIDKLEVPQVIASDCSSVALDCVYSGAGDDVTVRWLLNGSQVYELSEGMEPRASGVLEGRIDLSHKSSMLHPVQRQTLRMIELAPEMSGNYTCVVQSRGQEARLTKSMIVFSPEHEFELTFTRVTPDALNIKCIARRLHPRPDLTLEYNKIAMRQQHQRIWRFGRYYDAECTALLPAGKSGDLTDDAELACRLQIPQADYTVITKKLIKMGREVKSGAPLSFPRRSVIISITIGFMLIFFSK